MLEFLFFAAAICSAAPEAARPRPILPVTPEARPSPLFVGTLDGSLFALSRETGTALWTLNGGPLLSGTVTEHGAHTDNLFLPDPRDGSLYVANPSTNGLRRVGQTIHDLVHDAPFTAEDGNVYLGAKSTRVYALDVATGALASKYLPDPDAADEDSAPELHFKDDGSSIVIGRTEYTVTVRDRVTSKVRWNVTLAEYSHPLASLTTEQFAEKHPDFGNVNIVVDSDGQQLLTFSPGRGGLTSAKKWSMPFQSPIVAVYCASGRGALQKLPLIANMDKVHGVSTGLAPLPLASGPAKPASWQDPAEPHLSWLRVAKTTDGLLYAAATLLSPESQTALQTQSQALSLLPAAPHATKDVSVVSVVSIPWVLPSEYPVSTTTVSPAPTRPTFFPDSLIGDHIMAVSELSSREAGAGSHMDPMVPKATGQTFMSLVMGAMFATLVASAFLYRAMYRSSARAQSEAAQLAEALARAKTEAELATSELAAVAAASAVAASPDSASNPTGSEQDIVATTRSFPMSVGKLTLHDTVLGHGSLGTIIFKGLFEGQAVAVKRMLTEYYDVAKHEVELLRQSDDHPNVVRYFVMEQDQEFFYIGLELCLATLVQVVEGPSVSTRGTHHGAHLDYRHIQTLDRVSLARDFMAGVAHLHALNIVHRDIKPQNILLSTKFRAMISDFGLCKALSQDEHSFKSGSVGTHGWTAPELLKQHRTTKAVDVFSSGCVLHYLMYATHPFGPYYERETNIRKGRKRGPREFPVLDDLVSSLIHDSYQLRPSITEALAHPFYWAKAKCLSFLMDVSDRVEKESPEAPLVLALEAQAATVFGTDWLVSLTPDLVADLGRFRRYKSHAMIDLLRAIRNKKHHYQELPEGLKVSLGSVPDGFADYFMQRFPKLLVRVYHVLAQSPAKHEALFAPYFCVSV